MKSTAKKILSSILVLILATGMVACGSTTASAKPDKNRVQQDVQEYITSVIDSDAEISFLSLDSSNSDENEFTAVCVVNYANQTTKYIDQFNVSYSENGGKWEVNKISVDTSFEGRLSTDIEGESKESNTEELKPESTAGNSEIKYNGKLDDFIIALDGVNIQLPCKYEDVEAAEWTITSSGTFKTTPVSGNSYEDCNIGKSGSTITVEFTNFTGNEKTIAECKLTGIEVVAKDLYEPKAVSIGPVTMDFTVDDVTKEFGEPSSTVIKEDKYYESNYTVMAYEFGDDSGVVFYAYEKEDCRKYNRIQMINAVAGNDDITETSNEVPEYLAEYKAPDALGDDPTSMIFEAGGNVYKMPAPVSTFLDNGWKITQKEGAVASGQESTIYIEKDGEKLYANVTNFASYQTTPENCAVTSISTSSSGNTDKFTVKLPGNISADTSEEDVKAILGDKFKMVEYSSYISYSWYGANLSTKIDVAVDNETHVVNKISIYCCNWE